MNLVKAKLIAKATVDGLVEMLEHVPLGKEYLIDIDTLREQTMYNTEHDAAHTKPIVDTDEGLWLCADLLSWPGKKQGGH